MLKDQAYRPSSSGVASEQFDDEIILINLPRGNYYSLRYTAFELWGQLLNGATQSQLADFLSSRYRIDQLRAAQDSQAFIEQLLTEGLIAPAEATTPAEPPGAPATSAPYCIPALEVYSDMQDLLLLDPVHDVDSEQGWPIKK